ncbi:MAG: hypothetical protein WB992_07595 [Bryobacteraceae bacterium]
MFELGEGIAGGGGIAFGVDVEGADVDLGPLIATVRNEANQEK